MRALALGRARNSHGNGTRDDDSVTLRDIVVGGRSSLRCLALGARKSDSVGSGDDHSLTIGLGSGQNLAWDGSGDSSRDNDGVVSRGRVGGGTRGLSGAASRNSRSDHGTASLVVFKGSIRGEGSSCGGKVLLVDSCAVSLGSGEDGFYECVNLRRREGIAEELTLSDIITTGRNDTLLRGLVDLVLVRVKAAANVVTLFAGGGCEDDIADAADGTLGEVVAKGDSSTSSRSWDSCGCDSSLSSTGLVTLKGGVTWEGGRGRSEVLFVDS